MLPQKYHCAATLTTLFMHVCSEHFLVLLESLEFYIKYPPLPSFLRWAGIHAGKTKGRRVAGWGWGDACQPSKLGAAQPS